MAEGGGEAFDDEKNQGMPQWVKEALLIIAGILAACFRRQDVCGEKIKRTAEQKK